MGKQKRPAHKRRPVRRSYRAKPQLLGPPVAREPVQVVPPEALLRRAEIVGAANARDPRAGTALGQLLLSGRIEDDEYEGGVRLERLWREWSALAGAGPRHAITERRPPRSEDDAEAWGRCQDGMRMLRYRVLRLPRGTLGWQLLEWVAMDGGRPVADGLQALREALAECARFFRVAGDGR